ncbi:helix-turn-helix domain-containing protein [Inmirania thermothiophila]|uniref:Cytoskeleton protein RodZ n=1 Tax=Inmirania thermothiophila TaxID=1750597 RepID=A0A3N1XX10_9GAMM|nr:RodZ domain-containing protein [Inmirania thermothiophila]ROR29742.1 cytoskeleton protein RodZ [Inmirania thermothiophila]
MSEAPERVEAAEPAPAAAGARLREARRALGWSEDEAAQRLRVPRRYVEALEAGRCEELPGPVFARGYVRSYARLLGLPEDELLAALAPQPPEPAAPRPRTAGRPRLERVALVWGTPLVAAIAAVLVWLGWRGPAGGPAEEPPAVQAQAPVASEPVPPPPAAQPAPVPAAEPAPPAAESAPAAEEPLPAAAQLAPAPVGEAATETVADAGGRAVDGAGPPAPAAAGTPAPGAEADSGGGAEAASGEDAAQPPPPAQPAGDVLTLTVAGGDSWVEVRDARGERLVYQLLRDGAVRRVQGEAPFRVLLGNAGAVRLELNGQALTPPQPPASGVLRWTTPEG